MLLDGLLAFAIVMASATQLHLPGSEFTFGEIGLGLWVMLNLGRLMMGEHFVVTRAFVFMSLFWTGMALSLSIGVFVGYFSEILFANYLIHDSLAYILLALFTCIATSMPRAITHFRQVTWAVVLFASLALTIQIFIAYALPWSIASSAWYWDRFQGWSTNPNQLALYCAAYWPIGAHLFVTSESRRARIAAFTGTLIPVIAGVLTRSDAFLLTSLFTFLLITVLHLRWWAGSRHARHSGLRARLVILSVGIAASLLTALPSLDRDLTFALNVSKTIVRDKGSLTNEEAAGRRLALINEAAKKALLSASLGLGPGPHLESKPLNEPSYRASRFEAHNTYLDLYTQGGLPAVTLFVGILITAAVCAWRAKMAALVGLVCLLAVFGTPHLIIRHPILWYSICLCLVSGTASVPVQLSRTRQAGLPNRAFVGA